MLSLTNAASWFECTFQSQRIVAKTAQQTYRTYDPLFCQFGTISLFSGHTIRYLCENRLRCQVFEKITDLMSDKVQNGVEMPK